MLRSFRSRRLWILLAALLACHHLWVFHSTQDELQLLVMLMLIWGGALLCIEDLLPSLDPRPTRGGLILGAVLVVWSVLRAELILARDFVIYLLPLIEGLGLALLCAPPRRLRPFAASLLILSLFMPAVLVRKFYDHYPEAPLSHLTALATGVGLQTVGIPADVQGRLVSLPYGAVEVSGPCSGRDLMVMVILVAVIFLLAFPLDRWRNRMFVLLAAVPLAMLSNVIRIALLALIVGFQVPHQQVLFDFFHEDMGSLVFSVIAVALLARLYLLLIDRQLAAAAVPPDAGS
ncbi:exosortase/archaeosortase family protein [Synechococcus sp. CBW1107]|uniref:exosortase/archaeosortase family protein n=1 Tax=Synechococcus sp. CBW1107 TaxID=2789857 RepID=UPI001E4E1E86|nr:exosortase/archaeosortase family protein [Synechococcus sp. CBW1107]